MRGNKFTARHVQPVVPASFKPPKPCTACYSNVMLCILTVHKQLAEQHRTHGLMFVRVFPPFVRHLLTSTYTTNTW